MELSKMALKKLSRLYGFTQIDQFEVRFKNQVLFSGIERTDLGVIVDSESLDLIISRCEKYKIKLIGVETNIDLRLPYYDFIYEDYTQTSQGGAWCREPINALITVHGPVPLIIHIDLTLTECFYLETLTGVPFNFQVNS